MTGTAIDLPLQLESSDADVPIRSHDELLEVIREGLSDGYTGELAVRDASDVMAYVYLHAGRLAWVRCTTHRENLGDVLRRECGVSPAALQRAMTRCYETGEKFGEALTALGLVTTQTLRGALREHITAHAAHMLAMAQDLRASFRPSSHRYGESLTFSFEEIPWHAARITSRTVPAVEIAAMARPCHDALGLLEGTRWCGLVDAQCGRCLVECHPRGVDAGLHVRTILDSVRPILSNPCRDREIEVVLRGRETTIAMRVFIRARVVAAIVGPGTTPNRLLTEALAGLTQAARLWQASHAVGHARPT